MGQIGRRGILWALAIDLPVVAVWAVVWAAVSVVDVVCRRSGAARVEGERRAREDARARELAARRVDRERRVSERRAAARDRDARLLANTVGASWERLTDAGRDELRAETMGPRPSPCWWVDADDPMVERWWNGVGLTDLTRPRAKTPTGVARVSRAKGDAESVELDIPHGMDLVASVPVVAPVEWADSPAVDVSADEGDTHVDLTVDAAARDAEAEILETIALVDRADQLRRAARMSDGDVVEVAERLQPGAAATPWEWDAALWRRVIAELCRVSSVPLPLTTDRVSPRDRRRAELDEYRLSVFLEAQDACRGGSAVSKRGQAAGVDEYAAVTDPRMFEAYASEDLLAWASAHHYRPVSVAEWMEQTAERCPEGACA